MEFVVVTYPSARRVILDGAPFGRTNQLLRMNAGTHRFSLAVPSDFSPPMRDVEVIGTSRANPMVIEFSGIAALAMAGARTSAPGAAGAARKSRSKQGKKSARKPVKRQAPAFATRVFDARPDRLDFRDLLYHPPLRSLPPRFPTDDVLAKLLPGYLDCGLILDQGTEGACTGFGLACVVNHLLFMRYVAAGSQGKFTSASPRMLYELARRYDEWPGARYEGSSCRGALKGWHKHGVCAQQFWPYPFDDEGNALFVPPNSGWEKDSLDRTLGVYYRISRESIVDMQAAIVNIGAVYVSARVHTGWDALLHTRPTKSPTKHDEVPNIPPPEQQGRLGGHAFAFVGYDERGFIVQNSWGEVWGAGGFARLPYEDWVAHGTDAWACALGVPAQFSDAKEIAVRWHQPAGRSLSKLERVGRTTRNPSDDPWPVDHNFNNRDYEPLSTARAYQSTLVTGNDGQVLVRDLTKGDDAAAQEAVKETVVTRTLAWAAKQKGKTVKVAVYAHGGLNDEDGSIERVRLLAPYFLANDVYPLFLVWRTGPYETIQSLLDDWKRRIPGFDEDRATGLAEWLGDQKDRAIEAIARPLGRGIWAEMKENAERSMRTGHGVNLLVKNLSLLGTVLKAQGRSLEVHFIGHSAGSILVGHCLESMMDVNAPPQSYTVESCSLYAAACSVPFANHRFVAAADRKLLPLERLWLYCLDDDNEKRDALPSPSTSIYGKSLLYLVSRALDDVRKAPILGMERAHSPKHTRDDEQWADECLSEVKRWQQRWSASAGHAKRLCIVTNEFVRNTRAGGQIQATHGSFDNNIDVLTETIERIRGRKLVSEMEWLDY